MDIDDKTLQANVLEELKWEPSVNPAKIGVTVRNGIVTLTGHVESYAEKIAADRAARRVIGVKAIAQEVEVQLPTTHRRTDEDIAGATVRALEWDVSVPQDRVQVEVENGWVVLRGEVDWQYQRQAAEDDVRRLTGVVGVTNHVKIKPAVSPSGIRERIEQAFKRNAEVDAGKITISTVGYKVILGGKVTAWSEREMAERAAWSAPGVTEVEDRITVGF